MAWVERNSVSFASLPVSLPHPPTQKSDWLLQVTYLKVGRYHLKYHQNLNAPLPLPLPHKFLEGVVSSKGSYAEKKTPRVFRV